MQISNLTLTNLTVTAPPAPPPPPPPPPSFFVWGNNKDGQLGQNNTTYQSSPVQVGSAGDWATASIGQGFVVAIKPNGTMWSWGNNNTSQLGLGVLTAYQSSPVQVGVGNTWSKVSCGKAFSMAIKTDGTLWGWGENDQGQLGLGNQTTRNSPIQVGAQTTWSEVRTGRQFTIALKNDGTLWAWGGNTYGQLGNNTSNLYTSPIQIGAATWTALSAAGNNASAIKSDGTLWIWGRNAKMQSASPMPPFSWSSPVQVAATSAPNWSKVALGYYHGTALTTTGTLWAWGYGDYGQLGNGQSGGQYPSPIQIGSGTTWTGITAGCYQSGGVKSDGTLWTWGFNNYGQGGRGNIVDCSSPIQVGTGTGWFSPIMVGQANFLKAIAGAFKS
jgi:alpha-tubulin suppressor-like RCC1 family protein